MSGKSYDPFDPWRSMRDTAMESWSKSMIEAVNSEAYAQATGAMLDTYLTASAPFREALEKSMGQALQQLNMPTREDFISLAERTTNIEMRLDDLEAVLHRMELLLTRVAARPPAQASPAAPPRAEASAPAAAAHDADPQPAPAQARPGNGKRHQEGPYRAPEKQQSPKERP